MPLTPSIGLSVLVHIIVLIISGLRRVFRTKNQRRIIAKQGRRIHHPVLVNRFLGMIIPLTISVVIFSGAFKLVELALHSRYSSVHLAQRYITVIMAREPDTSDQNTVKATPLREYAEPAISKQESIISDNANFDCTPIFNNFADSFGWSVVNYLVSEELPFSLADRERLAAQLGISDYDAGNAKNLELMKALFIKNNEAGLINPALCRL